jgi:signal recognition particle subunit SRP54
MFERLSERLEQTFKKLRGYGKITPEHVAAMLREVRLALLEADVNYKVARDLEKRIRERAVGQEVAESLTPAQQVVKIVRDELTETLGGVAAPLSFGEGKTAVFMLVGLQGSGKTTTAAKLAVRLKKEGRRPLFVAADVYRPAAQEQLRSLGSRIDVPVVGEPDDDPVELVKRGVKAAAAEGRNLVIIDTAGRLHVDHELMAELRLMKEAVSPDEILMVADAMTGQEAVNIAEGFNSEVGLTGVVLTKMDGDARGGAAISIKSALGVPVKFVGTGERPEDLEPFHPDRLAARILGMGDMLSLIEKAEDVMDRDQARALEEKIRRQEFDLEDFRTQLTQVRKMGPLQNVLEMLPGAGDLKKSGLEVDEKQLQQVEVIIGSMTAEERRRPGIINNSRRRRIARGSGASVSDVNRMLKQFAQAQRMMKKMTKLQGDLKAGRKGRRFLPW